MEVVRVFETDRTGSIGGVTGAIRNQPYSEPKGLNRFLLAPGIGAIRGTFAGRLMGPAINFLPAANEESVQEVEWLPSCCVAYRREAFLKEQFPDTFEGYSFAEDVHLSSRVAKSYRVVCAGKARVFHHDLGKNTHKDWKALGKSMVLNRYAVMTDVLQRRSLRYFLQLAYFELFYTSATWIAAGLRKERLLMLNNLLSGKLAAFSEILRIRSHGRSIA
jgi:GT2 family glycosyltransferase